MIDVTVHATETWERDYVAHAVAWVMHGGILQAVVYTESGDTPWMVPYNQVSIKV